MQSIVSNSVDDAGTEGQRFAFHPKIEQYFGKLKGIRQRIKAARRVRRLINNFPYYRLVQYIRYKAAWFDIRVM